MAVRYRTQALILKKTDLREADQLFAAYTEDFGKLEILGKAVRKVKSKLRSGAELFYLSEIEFIQGKSYKTLTDAIIIDKFKNIRKDLDRLKIAYQIAELSDNLISGQEKDEKVWRLLNETFEKLNNYLLPAAHYSLIYYYFLWNLLSILGYQINLQNCAICQKKLFPKKLYFNPEEGGIIGLDCFKKIKKGKDISPEVVKILRVILKKDWQTLLRLKMEASFEKSLEKITDNYLSFVQEQNIV